MRMGEWERPPPLVQGFLGFLARAGAMNVFLRRRRKVETGCDSVKKSARFRVLRQLRELVDGAANNLGAEQGGRAKAYIRAKRTFRFLIVDRVVRLRSVRDGTEKVDRLEADCPRREAGQLGDGRVDGDEGVAREGSEGSRVKCSAHGELGDDAVKRRVSFVKWRKERA
jgi:hypothetical protein